MFLIFTFFFFSFDILFRALLDAGRRLRFVIQKLGGRLAPRIVYRGSPVSSSIREDIPSGLRYTKPTNDTGKKESECAPPRPPHNKEPRRLVLKRQRDSSTRPTKTAVDFLAYG